jgi:hypothetical protein
MLLPLTSALRQPAPRRQAPRGRTIRHQALLALAVLLIAAPLAGCDPSSPYALGRAKVNARCSKPGAFARDATNVLQCSTKKRWKISMSLAQASAMITAYNQPAPTLATGPTNYIPPPEPPCCSTGSLVGWGPGELRPGFYWAQLPAEQPSAEVGGLAQLCQVEWLYGDSSPGGPQRLHKSSFRYGRAIVELKVRSQVRFSSFEGCEWKQATDAPLPPPPGGTGTYRVGIDIPPGRIHLSGNKASAGPCQFGTTAESYGNVPGASVKIVNAPSIITIASEAKFLAATDCGFLTPVPDNPKEYIEYQPYTPGPDPVSLFYFGDGLERINSLDPANPIAAVALQSKPGFPQISVSFAMPTNGSIPNGTYLASRFATATIPGFDFSTRHGNCFSEPTSITVSGVQLDSYGRIKAAHVVARLPCADGIESAVTLHIEP